MGVVTELANDVGKEDKIAVNPFELGLEVRIAVPFLVVVDDGLSFVFDDLYPDQISNP